MSLAEILSSKFHICPRSFAFRPNINFSDNLSGADIISRHTSRLKGFFTNCLERQWTAPEMSVHLKCQKCQFGLYSMTLLHYLIVCVKCKMPGILAAILMMSQVPNCAIAYTITFLCVAHHGIAIIYQLYLKYCDIMKF